MTTISDDTKSRPEKDQESYEEVIERIVRQLEQGVPIDLQRLATRYPQYAEQLRGAVPALQAMFDLGLETAAGSHEGKPDASVAARALGDYRIVRELGRGGMGVVYEAEQISLGRRIALKVLMFASMLDQRHRQRFQNEARAAATLEHPHIVPIHAVGEQRGVHFYAMKLIHGRSLAEIIRELRRDPASLMDLGHQVPPSSAEVDEPLRRKDHSSGIESEDDTIQFSDTRVREHDTVRDDHRSDSFIDPVATFSTAGSPHRSSYNRRVAEIGAQAADALDHAHGLGVTHRDIKPGNLLLDHTGSCWVTDFGLAHIENEATLTRTGEMVGTLRYMSPEQASGQRAPVDGRSDIYGLGITLYELLTLQPAFAGDDQQQLLARILGKDPLPPRQLNPGIDRNLETIILKAIDKDPAHRFRTAGEMAADLRRFFNGEPIRSRRPGIAERSAKWCRRNQLVVVWIAGLMVLLSSVLAIAAVWINHERERALANLKLAQQAAQQQGQLRAEAEQSEIKAQKMLYFADMKLASQAWRKRNLLQYTGLLARHRPSDGQPDLRDFAWHYLWGRGHVPHQQLARHQDQVWCVDVSPDGRWLASAGADGKIQLYDSRGQQQATIDVNDPKDAAEREEGGGEPPVDDSPRRVHNLNFSPDNRRLVFATSDGQLRLWDLESGAEVWATAAHEPGVYHYRTVFASDGTLIASTGSAPGIDLWDPRSGQHRGTLRGHQDTVFGLAVSPVEPLLASASRDESVRLWNLRSQTEVRVLSAHTNRLTSVAFSPDGELLASGATDHIAHLWQVSSGDKLAGLKHLDEVGSVDFSDDGRWLAVGDRNHSIRLWRLQPDGSAREATQFSPLWEAHQGRINSLEFLPDGRLLSGGNDGRVKLWAPFSAPTWRIVAPAANAKCGDVIFAPNGRLMLIAAEHGIELWDAAGETRVGTLPGDYHHSVGMAVAPGGEMVAVADDHGQLQIWDLAGRTPAVTRQLGDQSNHLNHLNFSPDGKRVAVTDWTDDQLWIIEATSGRTLAKLPADQCHDVVFSADGNELAVDSTDDIVVWDWSAERRIRTLRGHGSTVNDMDLSPDRRRLASASDDRQVILWDWASGTQQAALSGHEAPVSALTFSPDGRLLISGDEAGSVFVWDLATELQICELERFDHPVTRLSFSPDGNRLACLLKGKHAVVLRGADQSSLP